jgi:hypothetical protein
LSLIVEKEFFERAREMREVFRHRFAHPFRATPDRFVWDYWHVPGQFTYLRTLARRFFPDDLFRDFQHRLTQWGTEKLGCGAVGEPWLSYYIDGCRQELHADSPNGPWSFVFSLTDWESRHFSGGETLLLNPHCLDFWRGSERNRANQSGDLVTLVAAHFNQLTVFDARIPHGVRTVEGVRDPVSSRIVIHGWFRPPELILSESLQRIYRPAEINAVLRPLRDRLRCDFITGLLTIRLSLGPGGGVDATEVLSNTLRSTRGDATECDAFIHESVESFATLTLPKLQAPEPAWLIVPLQLPPSKSANTANIPSRVFS